MFPFPGLYVYDQWSTLWFVSLNCLFILGHGIVDGLINVRIDKNQWNVQLDKPVSKKKN